MGTKINPPLLVAEIANSHQGQVEQVILLGKNLRDAGIKAIKLQIYSAEELLIPSHPRYEHFKNQAFSASDWKFIFDSLEKYDLKIFADVFGFDALNIARLHGVAGIKIPLQICLTFLLSDKPPKIFNKFGWLQAEAPLVKL